jgi:CHAT domain-containing protein
VTAELAKIAVDRKREGWQIAPIGNAATRMAFLNALADRGSWVHVAGHGSSNIDYLGRSGLWLKADDGDERTGLVSGIDIAQRRIVADTVVLNACALGNSASVAQSASTGFAEAVLISGAHQVVAALWPIDDVAAARWAAEFYADLPRQPSSEDVADATRRAMLSVRELSASAPLRSYGHPKYWAAQVHLLRLDTAAAIPPEH